MRPEAHSCTSDRSLPHPTLLSPVRAIAITSGPAVAQKDSIPMDVHHEEARGALLYVRSFLTFWITSQRVVGNAAGGRSRACVQSTLNIGTCIYTKSNNARPADSARSTRREALVMPRARCKPVDRLRSMIKFMICVVLVFSKTYLAQWTRVPCAACTILPIIRKQCTCQI